MTEEDQAGLNVVKFIRKELKNGRVRIVLRTGQPGLAPEDKIIVDYDINDYKSKSKSELTAAKRFTTLICSLRSFSLITIESNRQEIARLYGDVQEKNKILQKQVNTFGKFVPRQFLECQEIEKFKDIQPEQAKSIRLSTIFSDIRNFTKEAFCIFEGGFI